VNSSQDPIKQPDPSAAVPQTTPELGYIFSRQRWLETFLKGILRVSIFLGLVLIAAAYVTNTQAILMAIYITGYVALIIATFLPIPYQLRAGLFLFLLFALGVSSLLENGIHGDSRTFFPAFIIMTAMLFGHRASWLAVLLTVIAGVAVAIPILTGRLGLINVGVDPGSWDSWIMAYLVNILMAVLINTGLRTLQDEYIRSEQKSVENYKLLVDERNTLDVRVQERTAALQATTQMSQQRARQMETIAKVASQISQMQDINELLPTVTQLISDSLGFYHVGVFLIDEKKEYAVLMAANSSGGRRMLQRGHKLRIGQVGIVGYVAERGEARISLDVGTDAVFFDNPDLPETHSELALPLLLGKQVIGVMDVQSEQTAAFSQQDIDVMSTLANQVTVAIENARLFGETRQALAEAQALYGQYLRQGWQQTPLEASAVGYQYSNEIVKPLSKTIERPEIQSAIETGKIVVQTGETSALALPLKVREETIGVLNVQAKKPLRQWSENEIALVQAITDRVALALENARLFEETTRRADRERTVSEITTHIRTANDPQAMLQTALEDLKRALGASDIQIRPYSPQPAVPAPGKPTLPEGQD
jgi:GAF domain-containing protein